MPIKGQSKKETIHTEMRKFKHKSLHSGSKNGPLVRDRKQAVAIALSEARKVSKRAGGGKVKARQPKTEDVEDRRDEEDDRFKDSLYWQPTKSSYYLDSTAPVANSIPMNPLSNQLGAGDLELRAAGFADGGDVSDEPDEATLAAFPETYASPLVKGLASGMVQQAQVPGKTMAPNPYPEGSEEASWFEDQRSKMGEDWAHDTALSMLGKPPVGGTSVGIGAGKLANMTKKGTEAADDIHKTVMEAATAPVSNPALSKTLKTYYPKDIAASAFYQGHDAEGINNLKAHMSPGAAEAFDKHYGKMMDTAQKKAMPPPAKLTPDEEAEKALKAIEDALKAPSPDLEWPYKGPVAPLEHEQVGPEGWTHTEPEEYSAPKKDPFPSALSEAIKKHSDNYQGGPWKNVEPKDKAKTWVKDFDINNPSLLEYSWSQTLQAIAHQPLEATGISPMGIKAQKIAKTLDQIPTKNFIKTMDDFHLNDQHMENILSYLSQNKVDEIKAHLSDELKDAGYHLPDEVLAKSPAHIQNQTVVQNLKPVSWPDYQPPKGKVDLAATPWSNEFRDKLKELGFNPDLPLYKGGDFGPGQYPAELPDVSKKFNEKAFFAAHDPKVAQVYGSVGGKYVARAQKAYEVDFGKLKEQLGMDTHGDGTAYYDGFTMNKIINAARQQGADIVAIHNIHDVGGQGAHTQYAVINPEVLRAPHAAFDVTKLHLRYPLAGLAAGAGIYSYDRQDEEGAHMKRGGKTKHTQIDEDPQEHEFINFADGGLIDSHIPGRTDKIPMKVRPGSYVLPADIPSALGEGNSKAGAEILKKMFTHSAYGLPPPNVHSHEFHYPHTLNLMPHHHKAKGGPTDTTPIIAAGGEYIIHPDVVKAVGDGSMTKGHKVLDQFVVQTRKQHINTLKSLKPPK